jgi:hypothetical protein
MSSDSFRSESFRPWNPHEKPHPRRKRLGTYRYPSPVSLNATLFLAYSTGTTLDQIISVPRPEQHPLPVHPPLEVCVDSGPQSVTQVARQPEIANQISSIDSDSGNFGFGGIFCILQNLPGSENNDDMTFDPINTDFEPGNRLCIRRPTALVHTPPKFILRGF